MPQKRPFLQAIFISADEPRLRAGWRLTIHALLYLFLSLLIGVILGIFIVLLGLNIPVATNIGIHPDFYNIATLVLDILILTITTWVARRFLDRRPFSSLGLTLNRSAWFDFATGFLISAFQFSMIYLLTTAMGWSQFQSWAWENENIGAVIGKIFLLLVIFLGVAYREELLSRGYQLQNLAQGSNLPLAVVISSFIFSLLHISNPNVSVMAVLGLLVSGLFLAYGYIRTKALWLPIGLHLGWNFFEGTIFGFPVSGMTDFSLIQQQINGPEWITGGAFGPEAGLLLLPPLLIGAYLIKIYTSKRPR
jgi:membrane protease YdiL (CAAX protease family)